MTIRTIGYIQFKTHQVAISKDDCDHRIYCFKSTRNRCDYESFISEELAAEYILAPFPTVVYELKMPGENQT
jgi:hypothetical protein